MPLKPSNLITGIDERLAKQSVSNASREGEASPTDVFTHLSEVIASIGRYGITTAIFALPLVVACFGLYFLWVAVNGPEVVTAKVVVGIFTVVFGSGLLVLLLWMFNRYDLAKKLKPEATVKHKKAAA